MSNNEFSWENTEPNWVTLSFPLRIEKIYKDEHFSRSLQHVRIALLLSIFFLVYLEF